jgi:ATP-dependent exoDNAse (exonuclease V) beta subunit
MRQKGDGKEMPTAYDYLRRVEAERAAHETERLLYVAATRAIRRLHLVGVAWADDRKDDGLKQPASGTLLKLLWTGIAQPACVAALAEAAPANDGGSFDAASFVPPLLRLRQFGIPESLQAVPRDLRPADNPLSLDEAESGLSLETSVGTLLHRCLELVAQQGVETWTADRVAASASAYRRWLESMGHPPEAAERGAAEVVAALACTLHSEQGRWLLASHAEGAAEQAWSCLQGTQASHHVIDRCFVANGCRWIIDYKTARLPAQELRQRAESYRPQLERYAALFADDPRPLRMAIFFPMQGVLVELP